MKKIICGTCIYWKPPLKREVRGVCLLDGEYALRSSDDKCRYWSDGVDAIEGRESVSNKVPNNKK